MCLALDRFACSYVLHNYRTLVLTVYTNSDCVQGVILIVASTYNKGGLQKPILNRQHTFRIFSILP